MKKKENIRKQKVGSRKTETRNREQRVKSQKPEVKNQHPVTDILFPEGLQKFSDIKTGCFCWLN